MSLHHVEINVTDLKKSLIFWELVLFDLGYSLYQEWDEGRSYKKDDCYIVFAQTEKDFLGKAYHRKQTGLNHIAFTVESPENFDALVEKLRGKGYTLLYPDHHPFAGGSDYCAAYFEDPDRIKVEFVLESKEFNHG